MRSAGGNSHSPKKLSCDYVLTDNSMVSEEKTSEVGKMNSFSDGLVVKRNVPLPGDDVNSHPECVSSLDVAEKNGQQCYRNSVPPRDVTGEAFGLDDAAVQPLPGRRPRPFLLGRWPRPTLPGFILGR